MEYSTNSLFTACLTRKDISALVAIPECLYNDTEKLYLGFIRGYITDYGDIPPIDVFIDKNPTFRKSPVNDDIPINFIFDELIPVLQKQYISNELVKRQKNGQDPFKVEILEEITRNCKPLPLSITDYAEFDRTLYTNNRVRYSYGIPEFDKAYGGINAGDLIYLAGRMKSGKTTLLQIIIKKLLDQGVNVLAFSNEISVPGFISKLDAMVGGFNNSVFRENEIPEEIQEKLKYVQTAVKEEGFGKLMVAGRIVSHEQIISTMNALKEDYQVVAIDGVHLMGASAVNSSEKSLSLGEISRGIRAFCLDYNVPVVGVIQSNRAASNNKEPGTETVALSDTFARDCDVLMSCLTEKFGGQSFFKTYTTANRHGYMEEIYYQIDWDNMKMQFYDKQKIENYLSTEVEV